MHVSDEEEDNEWTPEENALYVSTVSSYKKRNIGLGIYHDVTTKSDRTVRNQRSLKIGNKTKAPPAEVGLRSIEAAINLLCDAYTETMMRTLGPIAGTMEYTIISMNRAAVQAVRNTRRAPHTRLLGNINNNAEAIRRRGGP